MTDRETFYMQLVYFLLDKFCNNTIEISREEWETVLDQYVTIKHRINANDMLEIVASKDEVS